MKHTPISLPATMEKSPGMLGAPSYTVRDADGETIFSTYIQEKADFVFKACNEYGKLKAVWDALCERMFDGWEFDYSDFLTIGEETGLLIKEIYDPEGKHKGMNVGDVEPGDECYFNVYALAKAEQE